MTPSLYYNRQGASITMEEWMRSFGSLEAKRVALDRLPNGYSVSTVWMGLDHNFGAGRPLIFETMVFSDGLTGDVDCDRYSTEAEAMAGHAVMVAKWSAPKAAG